MTTPSTKPRRVVRKADAPKSTASALGTRVMSTNDMSSLIPDKRWATDYVSRKVDGVADFDRLRAAHMLKQNTLIEGPTGCGKTMFGRAFAAHENRPFYAVSANAGKTVEQLVGQWVHVNGTWKWTWGPVSMLVMHGGVLWLNEANFFSPRMVSGLFSLLEDGRTLEAPDKGDGEVLVAHPDLIIVADMNPHYQGTVELNHAFRGRFKNIMVWDYDPAVEQGLVKSKSLRDLAVKIRSRATDFETPCSTKMLMTFEATFNHFGDAEVAQSNFINTFSEMERSAVRDLMRLHIQNIVRELTPQKGAAGLPEFEWDLVLTDGE